MGDQPSRNKKQGAGHIGRTWALLIGDGHPQGPEHVDQWPSPVYLAPDGGSTPLLRHRQRGVCRRFAQRFGVRGLPIPITTPVGSYQVLVCGCLGGPPYNAWRRIRVEDQKGWVAGTRACINAYDPAANPLLGQPVLLQVAQKASPTSEKKK